MTEGKIKKEYTSQLKNQLSGLVFTDKIEVSYKVFKPTNSRLDKGNVLSITQKYFLDALTEYGCIPDDNDNYVGTETFCPTELDRTNPRVEVTIKTVS